MAQKNQKLFLYLLVLILIFLIFFFHGVQAKIVDTSVTIAVPIRSNGSPSGTLPVGTTETIISLQTDRNATCKYSTAAGVPYYLMTNTFSAVGGTVHSQTITGLSGGRTYTFYVRCQDSFINYNADDYLILFSVASGGGGGGSGSYTPPPVVTQVIFSGRAYPKSAVTLLKDAQIAATTVAGADANFQVTLTGLSGGNYIFSIYSEDNQGIRSSLLSFPVSVTSGTTTKVSGIFITPTIAVDKSEVKRGDNIAIFGQSVPSSEITISVSSNEEFFNKTKADASGVYLYNFDTSPLEIGQHLTKSKAALNGEISSFSTAVAFAVGTKSVIGKEPTKILLKGDLNNDKRVNLVDFSIAAYWYKRTPSAAFKTTEKERLNGDGKIDLVDFSIMAYYWTG